jgi:L-histidine N-alpha-methyltransferase
VAISRNTSTISPRSASGLWFFSARTIGNLTNAPRPSSCPHCPKTLQSGDTLLLGTDLVKGTDRLVRAYDDSAGVTPDSTVTSLRS